MRGIITTLTLCLTITACGEFLPRSSKAPIIRGSESTGQNELTFDNVFNKVIGPKCASCHEDDYHANMKNYEVVKSKASSMLIKVENNTMPRPEDTAYRLTVSEKELLVAYLRAGAPRDETSRPPIEREKLQPNYNSLYKKVFAPKCIGCHQPEKKIEQRSETGEIKLRTIGGQEPYLESFQRYLDQKDDLFDFDDPEFSFFYEIITDEEYPMPPEEAGGLLPEEERKTILKWIQLKLPVNKDEQERAEALENKES